jgi:AraC-like DNA-binding protein
MYDQQQVFSDSLYLIVYGGAMILALIGCIYLLFRRSNAFAPEVTPPLRLRRWVAAFFVVMLLSHISWYVFVKYGFFGDSLTGLIVAAALDCMVLIPLIMGMLQAMLQDRRRPLWPFFLATLPVAAFFVVIAYRHDTVLVPWVQGYFMLMTVIMFIYMAFAVRQYSLWLRNNYADLENKEVWQSFMVLAICLLVLSFYIYSSSGMTYEYAVQVFEYLFIAILLWRVETLQTLENNNDNDDITGATGLEEVMALQSSAPQANIPANIGQLLEHYCKGGQLYLRQDITLSELSKAIGTNRYYLSQYFTRQETTYNAYINGLRIQHFVRLYQEAVAADRPFTAQQLAQESGFRSYSTFATAFKQRMGQTVMMWMRNAAK